MADKGLAYAGASVDIDAGNRMVELVKPLVRSTTRAGTVVKGVAAGCREAGCALIGRTRHRARSSLGTGAGRVSPAKSISPVSS